jgi:hypothetical protein
MLAVLQQFNLTRKQTGFFLDFVFAIKRASLKTFLTIHPYFLLYERIHTLSTEDSPG